MAGALSLLERVATQLIGCRGNKAAVTVMAWVSRSSVMRDAVDPEFGATECEESITDGNASFEHLVDVKTGNPVGPIYFFHKECPDGYHRELKAQRDKGLVDGSYGMDNFLIWLASNAGVKLDPEVVNEALVYGQLRLG